MPVSVAEGERSFSKLAIIKNHLRSPMGQDHLSSLVLLSCEHDLAKALNVTGFMKTDHNVTRTEIQIMP